MADQDKSLRNRKSSTKSTDVSTGSESTHKPKEETSLYTTIVHNTLIPLFLMVTTPPALIVFWMICEHYDGSVQKLLEAFLAPGNFEKELQLILSRWPMPNWDAAKVIGSFALLQAVFMLVLPGERFKGPITPRGNQPVYRLNGPLAHILTYVVIYLVFVQFKLVPVAYVFDNFGSILQTLSAFSFIMCFILYFKGLYFPSTTDSGSTGNPILDFYWGTELHPSLFGFNLKQFANCRFGMMGWCALLSIYALKQFELYGKISNSMMISVGLQAIYCMKFYLWEGGYFHTLDIMHDRFGYYIYWGVTCWITGIYTLTGFYLTRHPIEYDTVTAVAMFATGALFVWINWDADVQRQKARALGSKYMIWGKPAELMPVKYTVEKVTASGVEYEVKESVLLYSGWWGVARHFHYVPELLATFFWCLPAGTSNIFIPYFYFLYLTPLLIHRLIRDEERCKEKYGKYWDEYCKKVPYRFIPYIF